MKTKKQLCVASLLLFAGCASDNVVDYRNEPAYQIQVGEAVEIYIKENSCCIHCWVNENEAVAVGHTGEKVVVPAPRDCDGCNATYAWRFGGGAEGTDTIKIARLTADRICAEYVASEARNEPVAYVVTVTR